MLLVIHIVIALGSIIGTTWALLQPSKRSLQLSYALVGMTLASGTYLVWSTHSPLVASCTTGLIYICGTTAGLSIARHKLLQFEKLES